MFATITMNNALIIIICNISWTSPNLGKRGSLNLSALSEVKGWVYCRDPGILYKYRILVIYETFINYRK